MRRLVFLFALLVVPVPSWASKEVERLQIQVSYLQTQITELHRLAEDNLKELRRLNEALAEQTALLKRSAQDQRAQDETIQGTLRDLADRLGDLRERVQSTASAGPATSPPSLVPSGVAPAAASAPAPRELYSQAYADWASGKYDLALQEFQEYLRSYPNATLSDGAQYWIGKCYFAKQRYQEAIEAWNTLIRDFPTSEKVPEARVAKGSALEKLGRRTQALQEYRYVVDRFPGSSAARAARERLNPQ